MGKKNWPGRSVPGLKIPARYSLCTQTLNPMYTILNTKHAIANSNNIHKFRGIPTVFTTIRRAKIDSRQTDKPTSQTF